MQATKHPQIASQRNHHTFLQSWHFAALLDVFLFSSLIVLIFSSVAKFSALASRSAVLDYSNPVFGFLPNTFVLGMAATLEIGVVGCGIIMRYKRRQDVAFASLAWLATILALYRLSLTLMGVSAGSCGCLGELGKVLYPSQNENGKFVIGILAFLLCSGFGGWWFSRLTRQTRQTLGTGGFHNPRNDIADGMAAGTGGARILGAALFMALAGLDTHAGTEAAGYRVQGRIENLSLGKTNSHVIKSNSIPFSIDVEQSGRWKLNVAAQPAGTWRFVCDGTNVFEMFFDPQAADYPVPTVLHQDGFPAVYPATFIWFAYASGDYLNQSRLLVAPWIPARHDPRAFAFEASIERFGEPPGLPSAAEFTPRRSLSKSAANSPVLQIEGVQTAALRQRKQLAESVHDGFLEAEYSVDATTNINDFFVPTRFTLTFYRIPSKAITNPVAAKLIGIAENVSAITDDSHPPLPELGEHGASVTDRRFSKRRVGIDCIQYNVTDKWIMDTKHPLLLRLFEEKKRAAPFMRPELMQNVLVAAFFGFLVFAPLIWWAVRRTRDTRKTTKTERKERYANM